MKSKKSVKKKVSKEKGFVKIEALRKAAGVDTETAPLLEIRQRPGSESKIMVGANTELYLDGQKVRGAQGVRFEVNAKGIAKATITLIGRFAVKGRPVTKQLKLYK
jgi:hypothetical protein